MSGQPLKTMTCLMKTDYLDEGDIELFQDESDEEIQLQPQEQAHNTRHTCVICMDRTLEVVLVPCGHQNICKLILKIIFWSG